MHRIKALETSHSQRGPEPRRTTVSGVTMKYAMIAVVIAFLCAVQSALAAKAPPAALPSGVKTTVKKQRSYAPPTMNEVAPKAVAPLQVESAYEQGSETAAVAEEPEAEQPYSPAGNAAAVAPVGAPKQAPKTFRVVAPAQKLHTVATPSAEPMIVKKKELEIETDDDGEVEVEAKIKLAPAPGARKFDEDDYVFSDEELGIAEYTKPRAAPAPKARAARDAEDDKPLVELPEPIDGYSPEFQEGKSEGTEESAEEGSVMIAENKRPGTIGFEMDTVDMLNDSIEPTGEVSEVAKRK